MTNLTMKVYETQKHLYICEMTKEDMRMWFKFLSNFNGKLVFLNETFISSTTVELHTDAAQSNGYGGIYKSKWFYGAFSDDWKNTNIITLEFYLIIVALEMWRSLWRNLTDNEALVAVINKQTSQYNRVMKTTYCSRQNIYLGKRMYLQTTFLAYR
jgi:hypothetical protein